MGGRVVWRRAWMLETTIQSTVGPSPPRDALQGWAISALLEWDTRDVLALTRRLWSEFRSCPLHTDRPRGLLRSFTHPSFLLAFDREALIRDSVEARNVLINHGFPDGGLILAVFSRVVQNFHSGCSSVIWPTCLHRSFAEYYVWIVSEL